MIAEIEGALTGLKAATGIIKALFDTAKEGAVREKVMDLQNVMIDLQTTVLELQARVLSLHEENVSLKETIKEREIEIEKNKEWDQAARRYKLVRLGTDAQFAYSLVDADDTPPHYLCPVCFESKKKTILQYAGQTKRGSMLLKCFVCKTEVFSDFY
jgi:hypothetical protein